MNRRGRRVPWLAVVVAGIGFTIIVVPLIALLKHAPWGDLGTQLNTPQARDALKLSLVCSLWATALAVLFGVPLAWVFARVPFPGRSVAWALTILPMVLPPVVGGVGLLYAFGRRGIVGRHLWGWFHVQF
ncbi:MAG TPA: molybdate ABC transporter permease subunit, partial [Acidimicrobiia bacterium]|nr:molybdate ABC transporter permease subunit [Acidimicrobiia bacterium]